MRRLEWGLVNESGVDPVTHPCLTIMAELKTVVARH